MRLLEVGLLVYMARERQLLLVVENNVNKKKRVCASKEDGDVGPAAPPHSDASDCPFLLPRMSWYPGRKRAALPMWRAAGSKEWISL